MPYGYHVFLTSFIDTAAPARNLPLPIVGEQGRQENSVLLVCLESRRPVVGLDVDVDAC